MTFIEFKETVKEDRAIIKKTQISPSERLQFANRIMVGLGVTLFVSIVFFGINLNEHGKFVFLSCQQLISNFGAFIMGFYFSRK